MNQLVKLTTIKKDLEALAATRSRQEGALEERLSKLKELTGTDDVGKASKSLNKLEAECESLEKELELAVNKFEHDYKSLL